MIKERITTNLINQKIKNITGLGSVHLKLFPAIHLMFITRIIKMLIIATIRCCIKKFEATAVQLRILIFHDLLISHLIIITFL